MGVNFRVKTQAAAYKEGAMDAYDLLVTMLEEGGINNLLDGIANNAKQETAARLEAHYATQRQARS